MILIRIRRIGTCLDNDATTDRPSVPRSIAATVPSLRRKTSATSKYWVFQVQHGLISDSERAKQGQSMEKVYTDTQRCMHARVQKGRK